MTDRKYAEYAWEQTEKLLNTDSPTGYTSAAAEYLKNAFEKLGFET